MQIHSLTSSAVSALSSRVKGTLIVFAFFSLQAVNRSHHRGGVKGSKLFHILKDSVAYHQAKTAAPQKTPSIDLRATKSGSSRRATRIQRFGCILPSERGNQVASESQ